MASEGVGFDIEVLDLGIPLYYGALETIHSCGDIHGGEGWFERHVQSHEDLIWAELECDRWVDMSDGWIGHRRSAHTRDQITRRALTNEEAFGL